MDNKIITCPKCNSGRIATMPCVYTGIDGVFQLFCKDCGQIFDVTGQALKDHFEVKHLFTCPYCKEHDIMVLSHYTGNIYEVMCKSCGKILYLCLDATHEEKEKKDTTNKQQAILTMDMLIQ